MDPKKIRVLVRIWLIIVTIVTGLSLLETAALFLFGFLILLGARREIAMLVNSTTAIIMVFIFLIIASILILPLVFAWKSWKNEKIARALILSMITIGLIVVPNILFLLLK